MEKEGYHRALKEGKLSYTAVNKLLDFIRKRGMNLEKLRTQAMRNDKYLEILFCRINHSLKNENLRLPAV